MKIKGIELVAEIGIKQVVGSTVWRAYENARTKDNMEYNWSSLMYLPPQVAEKFKNEEHEGFMLTIIGYPMPDFAQRGMTRREAQTMLRNFGLKPLSTLQTVQIATQTLFSGQMLEICKQNDHRRIVATPPIHPESPDFFYFGTGHDETGSFRHVEYQKIYAENEKDNLYFWHHGGNDENPDVSPHERYHFPLLLGTRK